MHKILANTVVLGKDILYLPECHSTNDIAKQKLKEKIVAEGSIIITDKQTNGRGQRGNQWQTEPGQNLTFSLILTPFFLDASEQFDLNIAVSLGIRAALSEYLTGIKVKWPNDIVHEKGGKLGGILIENFLKGPRIEASVVGIGLNVNQMEFPVAQACSMALLAGSPVDKEDLFEKIISSIEYFYLMLKNRGKNNLVESYQSHLYRFGEICPFDDGEKFNGKITGIAEDGKLVIQKENQELFHYAFKEVRFL